MNIQENFQLNLYINNNTNMFNFFNINVTTGLFYPIVIIQENSQITESQANDFKNSVYAAFSAIKSNLIL